MNTVFHGFLIGIANIIPGVSGGTMALMLGIYQRLLSAIAGINLETIRDLLASLQTGSTGLKAQLVKTDLLWLVAIATGALGAIVATSKLITYLFLNWHDPTYGFFLGLVLFSIAVPFGMLKSGPKASGIICFALSLTLTIGLVTSISGAEKLDNAQKKYELKQSKNSNSTETNEATTAGVSDHSPTHLGYLFFAGAVAISAMILPGISGAFILLLFGVYFEVLEAIVARDLIVIAIFASGCGVGILVFTRLLNYILEKFHDQTILALVGLMVGSLFGLWPFQSFEIVGSKRIDLEPIVPVYDMNFVLTVSSFAMGGLLVFAFLKQDKQKASS